jgi:APA family basic amino acid/polyamine antiporter
VAFGKFLGVLIPAISSQTVLLSLGSFKLTSVQAVAISVLMLLTAYNCRGIKQGALMQNIFTTLKVLALSGIIVAGIFGAQHGLPNPSQWAINWNFDFGGLPFLSAFAVATVGSMFAADAWNNVTFIGSEIKNPKQNLPRALFWGTLLVLSLYVLANVAYINLLPFDMIQHAPEDRVATAAMNQLWGSAGSVLMACIILVSAFGCLNGMILAGARVFYAMAHDNLFFASFKRVHPKFHSPTVSLIGQGICAAVLTLSGSYGQLLDYTLFTTLLFYVITIVGMLRLARTHAQELGMTSWTSYIVPVTYLILVSYISINLALFKQQYTLPGLGIVSLGIPIYFAWKAFHQKKAVGQTT